MNRLPNEKLWLRIISVIYLIDRGKDFQQISTIRQFSDRKNCHDLSLQDKVGRFDKKLQENKKKLQLKGFSLK